MRNGILKWAAVICAIMLLPLATMEFAAASHMAHGCSCCQGSQGGGTHNCGMQDKSVSHSNCTSCGMPLLPTASLAPPLWKAFPYQSAQVDARKLLFVRSIFRPPKIS